MDIFRGHKNHSMIEPRYGAAVVGYSAFSESYASKSEQVVEYGGLGGKPYKEGVGEVHQPLQPAWNSSPHDRLNKTGKSTSPRVRPGSAWNNVHVGNSPPSKNHSAGKYDNYSSDESDDDDVVCDENGYCYPKPKHDEDYAPNYGYNHNNYKSKPNGNGYTTPPPQPYYETSKPNGNGYTQQPYYETSKPKGYDYSTPPPQPYYEVPDGYPTPPPQPHYETSNNKAMVLKPLPNVKTKRPNKATLESQVESMRINSPMSPGGQRSSPKSPYASSPRSPYSSSPLKDQDYRETINSGEARRRYGGAVVGAPVEQYKGTIDGQEAARRYRGVFFKY
ncbi:hypothetical protein ACS0TY_024524 [Phlomoides rotata]